MARLSQNGFPVPEWFCVSSKAFEEFVRAHQLKAKLKVEGNLATFAAGVEKLFLAHELPSFISEAITRQIEEMGLADRFLAVRSSGLDEDSADNSFAGQFSSYLFQKGTQAIADSLRKCWASGFSERALSYRMERGVQITDIGVGVVIQLMVDAESAGVAFSRNPIKALDRDHCLVSSVWGLGEGLVSGELDADHFEVHRKSLEAHATIVEKTHAFRQASMGGLIKKEVSFENQKLPSLTSEQVGEVAKLALELEQRLGSPQDCEFGFEKGKLYCLQTRPITTLPVNAFFDHKINGDKAYLWDNSNIIESYSGVTSPLTFSFASAAYRQVYIQFCEVMGVPQEEIVKHEAMYRNMLGLIRGRIYYNLINWYRLVLMLPGTGSNKGFMETMMGVKQGLKPEVTNLFDFVKNPPHYSILKRIQVTAMTVWRFFRLDHIMGTFQADFVKIYNEARAKKFTEMSLSDQIDYYQHLNNQVLRRWHAPIINDYLCMIFFGILKKLTDKWLIVGETASSLQNDLLCGQGDLESTEPTKMLMRIAEQIDNGDAKRREWFISTDPTQVWKEMTTGKHPELWRKFEEFLDKYGFRCINELKLEEPDLHDDPTFVFNAVASYVRMKAYSIQDMEVREKAIRHDAEIKVDMKIFGNKRKVFYWILKQARRAVRNRENLRFARTKIFESFGIYFERWAITSSNSAKLKMPATYSI